MKTTKRKKRTALAVDAVIDIECADWTTWIAGGIEADGISETWSVWEERGEERFVRQLLNLKGTIWAHAGGLYDFKWLLDWIVVLGIRAEVICAGSRIIMIKLPDLEVTFKDSWALVAMSLADFTESLDVSKSKLNLPCVCGDDCGGYCSISKDLGPTDRKMLLEYLSLDCRSLWHGLMALDAFAEEHDLDLKATIGSSAWANAARTIDAPDVEDFVRSYHSTLRQGYFGGRVEVYHFGRFARVHEFDINSAYPWALTRPLPVGKARIVYGREARAAFSRSLPGFYDAVFDQRHDFIPRLPKRLGKGRVVYPADTVSGFWSLPELGQSGEPLDVRTAIIWETEDCVLAPWVERLFGLRAQVGPKTTMGKWIKLYLNSLSGKLGQKPWATRIDINPANFIPCKRGPDCYPFCNGDCGAHFEIGDRVFGRKEPLLADCAHVEWASYLTARARTILHRGQLEGGGFDMVYSDTDAVIASGMRVENVGAELGQFKYEGPIDNFEAFAPKVYQGEREGKPKLRAKGIRLGKNDKTLRLGETYDNNKGVIGARLGAKAGKFFVRKEVSRVLARNPGGRMILSGGETCPMSLAELRERFE